MHVHVILFNVMTIQTHKHSHKTQAWLSNSPLLVRTGNESLWLSENEDSLVSWDGSSSGRVYNQGQFSQRTCIQIDHFTDIQTEINIEIDHYDTEKNEQQTTEVHPQIWKSIEKLKFLDLR